MLADENAKAGADPAFDAHLAPIGDWANDVWENWVPLATMNRVTIAVKKKVKKAKNIWAVVKGPTVAMVASCTRLGWKVNSSTSLTTDLGDSLDLLLDPPAVVKLEVTKAVKRWRWRNLEKLMPQLARGGSGVGALMEPVHALLKSKENSETWNPALRGALRSAIAGRQYPQARAYCCRMDRP